MDSKKTSNWRLIDSRFLLASLKGVERCFGSKLSKSVPLGSFKPNTVLASVAASLKSEPLAVLTEPLLWSAMALINVDSSEGVTTNDVIVWNSSPLSAAPEPALPALSPYPATVMLAAPALSVVGVKVAV